jgi:zona occludens toxin (predicted ATPase)
MIKLYTGTPGSGKSFHVARDIILHLRWKRNIISTVDIDINRIDKNGKRKIGDFKYIPIYELTPNYLYKYAKLNHKKGKEGQTWIIIDECQLIFNSRLVTT